MFFQNSSAFWFLPLLAIPIIIHLINFRKPEKLEFSSILFIEELQKTTVRKLKIKDLILLAIRLFAILTGILLFANPIISDSPDAIVVQKDKTSVFILENGVGTDRVDENGPILNQLKSVIEYRIQQLDESAQVILMPTTGQIQQPVPLSPKEALKKLEKIQSQTKASHLFTPLKNIFDAGYTYVSVYSDKHEEKWRYSLQVEEPNLKEALPIHIDWVQIGNTSTSNVYVSGLELENQVVALGRPLTLRVDVSGSGSSANVNCIVRCVVDDQIRGEYQFDLNENEQKSFQFELNSTTAGIIEGYIEIQGDVYLTDNLRPFAISIPENRTVAVLTDSYETDEELVYMRALFDAANSSKSDIHFDLMNLSDFTVQKADSYSAYIFLGLHEIPDFLVSSSQQWLTDEKGLIVIPSAQSAISSYNNFFSKLGISIRYKGFIGSFSKAEIVSKLRIHDFSHPIIQDLFDLQRGKSVSYDAPNVFVYLKSENNSTHFSSMVLKTDNEEPLLVEERIQRGKVLISTLGMGTGWSAFSTNSFFAPFWYKASFYLTSSSSGGLFQQELGKPVRDKIQSVSDVVNYQIGDSYSEKPLLTKRGTTYQTELSSYELFPAILQLQNKNEIILEKGLFLPPAYSHFTNASEEKINSILSQYVKEITVYDVNSLSEEKKLQTASEFGINLWPFLAGLGILLLILESSVAVWVKVD